MATKNTEMYGFVIVVIQLLKYHKYMAAGG